jgi:tetratricopeptide (TPR) repeat protein
MGLHAFALEELGRCEEALRLAERCVDRNRQDTWGIHALAHALYEMGAWDEGLARVPPALEASPDMNYYRNHLLWHLVLMELSRGDYARASAMTHDVFERAPSPLALDLRNSISLLWRFEICGMDVKDRWAPFVEIATRFMNRPEDLMFHHAHLAMPLAAGGDWASARAHLAALRARVPTDGTGILEPVVIPLIEGLHAFARRDWSAVIDHLAPIRARIVEIGGSRTQRDVFHDTLLEACFRVGRTELAGRLLTERVARRPDHFWVNRQRVATAPLGPR